MNAHDLIFHEELFAETAGWTPIYSDDRFTQRARVEPRGAMYSETRLTVAAPAPVVIGKLRAEWTWWKRGRYCNRVERPDGTVRSEHYPFGHNVHVNSIMYPPLDLEGGGVRIRVEISDYMSGTTYYDVLPKPDGTTEIVSRFSRCFVTGPYRFLPCPGHIAVRIHLAAERGRFIWPRGTGFPGLIAELEGAAAR
jgi:hypothetical protein